MIPVRVPADAKPVLASERRMTILPGHPLYDDLCPVCDGLLGETVTVLVFAGIDPENHKPAGWTTGAAVAVHAFCAGVSEAEQGTAVTAPPMEAVAYDPVYELAKLVATAFSDPMLFGMREGLRVSLGVGAGTSVALIEMRIRERVTAAPGSVTFDLSDPFRRHVLTQALEEYATRQQDMAVTGDSQEMRLEWAAIADEFRAQAEAATG